MNQVSAAWTAGQRPSREPARGRRHPLPLGRGLRASTGEGGAACVDPPLAHAVTLGGALPRGLAVPGQLRRQLLPSGIVLSRHRALAAATLIQPESALFRAFSFQHSSPKPSSKVTSPRTLLTPPALGVPDPLKRAGSSSILPTCRAKSPQTSREIYPLHQDPSPLSSVLWPGHHHSSPAVAKPGVEARRPCPVSQPGGPLCGQAGFPLAALPHPSWLRASLEGTGHRMTSSSLCGWIPKVLPEVVASPRDRCRP